MSSNQTLKKKIYNVVFRSNTPAGNRFDIIIIYMIVVNFGSLSGASGFLGAFLPGLVLIAALVGIVLASVLKGSDAKAYARLGEPLND